MYLGKMLVFLIFLFGGVFLFGCDPLLGMKIEVKTKKQIIEKKCALTALHGLEENRGWDYITVEKRTTFNLFRGFQEKNAFETYILKHENGTRTLNVEQLDHGGQIIEIGDIRIGENFKVGEKDNKKAELLAIYDALTKACPGMPPLSAVKEKCLSVTKCE